MLVFTMRLAAGVPYRRYHYFAGEEHLGNENDDSLTNSVGEILRRDRVPWPRAPNRPSARFNGELPPCFQSLWPTEGMRLRFMYPRKSGGSWSGRGGPVDRGSKTVGSCSVRIIDARSGGVGGGRPCCGGLSRVGDP